MHVRDRPHGLDGHAVGVEQLEVERLAHRRLAVDAAVALDRHDAQGNPRQGPVARAGHLGEHQGAQTKANPSDLWCGSRAVFPG